MLCPFCFFIFFLPFAYYSNVVTDIAKNMLYSILILKFAIKAFLFSLANDHDMMPRTLKVNCLFKWQNKTLIEHPQTNNYMLLNISMRNLHKGLKSLHQYLYRTSQSGNI